jgi:hypothetical protein
VDSLLLHPFFANAAKHPAAGTIADCCPPLELDPSARKTLALLGSQAWADDLDDRTRPRLKQWSSRVRSGGRAEAVDRNGSRLVQSRPRGGRNPTGPRRQPPRGAAVGRGGRSLEPQTRGGSDATLQLHSGTNVGMVTQTEQGGLGEGVERLDSDVHREVCAAVAQAEAEAEAERILLAGTA